VNRKSIEAFGQDPKGLDGEATKAAVPEGHAPNTVANTVTVDLEKRLEALLAKAEWGVVYVPADEFNATLTQLREYRTALEARPAMPEREALRPEVLAFAQLMERQLRANDHKPGWKNDDPAALSRRIAQEHAELQDTMRQCRGAEAIGKEAADVANFSMMVADVCGALPTTGDVREAAPETLAFVQHWMMSGDHEPDQWHRDFAAAIDARCAAKRAMSPEADERAPKHRYWGAGEPDCPRDIKAGNGELHTLRCKICGLDDPRNPICHADKHFAAISSHPSAHDMREALQPFALISTEGVVKELTGHVTVTTCAEYFHRAAAALACSPMDAVKAAVEEEREACAKAAEKTAPGMDWDGLAYSHGKKIAHAIRARAGGAK